MVANGKVKFGISPGLPNQLANVVRMPKEGFSRAGEWNLTGCLAEKKEFALSKIPLFPSLPLTLLPHGGASWAK